MVPSDKIEKFYEMHHGFPYWSRVDEYRFWKFVMDECGVPLEAVSLKMELNIRNILKPKIIVWMK